MLSGNLLLRENIFGANEIFGMVSQSILSKTMVYFQPHCPQRNKVEINIRKYIRLHRHLYNFCGGESIVFQVSRKLEAIQVIWDLWLVLRIQVFLCDFRSDWLASFDAQKPKGCPTSDSSGVWISVTVHVSLTLESKVSILWDIWSLWTSTCASRYSSLMIFSIYETSFRSENYQNTN